jgi:hypothetical protein
MGAHPQNDNLPARDASFRPRGHFLYSPPPADRLTGLPADYVKLVADLARVPVPHIPVTPYGDDFRAAARHWEAIAEKLDAYAEAFRREVKANSPYGVDDGVFCNPFADAVHDMVRDLEHVADRLDQERRR